MDVVDQRRQRRIVLRPMATEAIAQNSHTGRLSTRMNVVSSKFANGPLLLHIRKANLFPRDRLIELMSGALLASRALEERLREHRRSIVLIRIGDSARLACASR